MLSGLLLIAAVVLLGQSLGSWGIVPLAVTLGVLAGLVQMLGLLRWVYLVPSLARTMPTRRRRLGNGRRASPCSERCISTWVSASASIWATCYGHWSVLIGVAIARRDVMPSWLGWVGVVVGAGLILGSAEFLGPNEEHGWKLAGAAIPILYIVWSIWLLAMGIAFVA